MNSTHSWHTILFVDMVSLSNWECSLSLPRSPSLSAFEHNRRESTSEPTKTKMCSIPHSTDGHQRSRPASPLLFWNLGSRILIMETHSFHERGETKIGAQGVEQE